MAYKFIDAVLWYRNLGGAEEIKFGPPKTCAVRYVAHGVALLILMVTAAFTSPVYRQ